MTALGDTPVTPALARDPMPSRIARSVARRLMITAARRIRVGHLTVVLPDGRSISFGDARPDVEPRAEQRAREAGLLRTIGALPRQVRTLIVYEAGGRWFGSDG